MDDIVEGLLLAQKVPGGAVINVGGGNRVTLAEAIGTLGEISGITPRVDVQPVEPGDVHDTWADVSRAQQSTGYYPATKLAEGMAQEFTWLAGNRGLAP